METIVTQSACKIGNPLMATLPDPLFGYGWPENDLPARHSAKRANGAIVNEADHVSHVTSFMQLVELVEELPNIYSAQHLPPNP